MTQLWQAPVTESPSGNGYEAFDDWDLEERIHQELIRDLDDSVLRNPDRSLVRERVEEGTRQTISRIYPGMTADRKEGLVHRVVDDVLGLGPIEPLLRDQDVSEVMVNGPTEVFYEKNGILHESTAHFRDNAHIHRVIDRIVSSIGRHVDEASPMVDARLADGSRVNVVIPPLVPSGPTVTIRRFLGDRYSMQDLVAVGTLTEGMGDLLEACVRARLTVVVSGGTGSGKTTLLNALSSSIPDRERIVTIEDPIELKLQQRHTVSMEARPASTEGRGEVTQRDLVRNALRMRPDRIVVGEVRGSEAFDMLQAMNTGHDGSLTTVHANTPRDALARVENMVMMAGFDLPVQAIREQMASAFQVIVQLARLSDGSRRVTSFSEVTGMEGPTVTMQDVFKFDQTGVDPDGRVLGETRPTGIRPTFAERLSAHGLMVDGDVFAVGRWG